MYIKEINKDKNNKIVYSDKINIIIIMKNMLPERNR